MLLFNVEMQNIKYFKKNIGNNLQLFWQVFSSSYVMTLFLPRKPARADLIVRNLLHNKIVLPVTQKEKINIFTVIIIFIKKVITMITGLFKIPKVYCKKTITNSV